MQHICIDTETLDTRPDAAIVSIGSVRFNLETGEIGDTFYRVLELDYQLTGLDRTVSAATIKWWMQQADEAREVFTDPEAYDPFKALIGLGGFINKSDIVWACDPDFDCVKIESLCRAVGVAVPWKYNNTASIRTYRRLPGAGDMPRAEANHNAVDDAVRQAKELCEIHARVFGDAFGWRDMASAPKDGRKIIHKSAATGVRTLVDTSNGLRKVGGEYYIAIGVGDTWKPAVAAPALIQDDEWQALDTVPTDGTAIKIRAPMELVAKYDGKRWVAMGNDMMATRMVSNTLPAGTTWQPLDGSEGRAPGEW